MKDWETVASPVVGDYLADTDGSIKVWDGASWVIVPPMVHVPLSREELVRIVAALALQDDPKTVGLRERLDRELP